MLNQNRIGIIASGLMGVIAFYLCGGFATLNVTNIDFLMSGDPAQHWVGWEFFRNSPMMQWPIGKNTAYGLELNNSIVYTDSIPIFAVLFKLLSPVLPDTFQYTGIWLLSCFILQGVFGYLLVNKLTNNTVFSVISSVLFVIAVPFIQRTGGHFALSAHWLILSSLLMYFTRGYSGKRWLVIILLTSWVHAYLLAMVLAVWLVDGVNKVYRKELTAERFVKISIKIGVAIYVAMYSIGYFMVSKAYNFGGFGVYKMNLNALFNPIFSSYSAFIKPMPVGSGDYEGINYLGLGVMAIVAVVFFVAYLRDSSFKKRIKDNLFLFTLCILLFIYALSNNITLGTQQIIGVTLPSALDGITEAFRSSGRFFWVPFYVIFATSVSALYFSFKKSTAIVLLAAFSFVQIYDIHRIFSDREKTFTLKPVSYKLNDQNWKYVSQNYSKLLAVSPWSFVDEYIKWAYFASTNNMSMNFGYFARFNGESWNKQTSEIETSVNSENLDPNAVYLFKDREHFEKVIANSKKTLFHFEDGNVYVIGVKR